MCRRGCSLGCRCRCRGMRPYIKLHGRRRVCCQLEWSMGRRVMQVPVVCVCLCVFSSWSRAVVRRSDRQRDGRGRTDGRSAVFRRLSQQIQGEYVTHRSITQPVSRSDQIFIAKMDTAKLQRIIGYHIAVFFATGSLPVSLDSAKSRLSKLSTLN